jgi:hypothetical protein
MFTNLVVGLASGGTIAIGAVGILVALRNQYREWNAQMYIEFSGRFQQLLRSFFPSKVGLTPIILFLCQLRVRR